MKKGRRNVGPFEFGAPEEIRTPDPLVRRAGIRNIVLNNQSFTTPANIVISCDLHNLAGSSVNVVTLSLHPE